MTTTSRGDLIAAMNVLVKRRGNTADVTEQATIDDALDQLAGWVQDLNQAGLLDAARIVAQASDELEEVVASARMAPFDNYLTDIHRVIDRLQNTQAAIHAIDRLPTASPAQPTAPLPKLAAAAAVLADASAKPIDSTTFMDLRDEYQSYFNRCTLRDEFKVNLDFYISRLLKFRAVYEDVSESLGVGIPWTFIGIIHGMECGFNFTTHLHNGDPLANRTVRVPPNRPVDGLPPFTWRDSARDALLFKGYDNETDWSVPHMLYLWEKYNGFGYRSRGVPSPYLWSFSNLYRSGKFVADHQFDPNAVSKQCGCAIMLKTLQKSAAD
jgi:lysozyme family protein